MKNSIYNDDIAIRNSNTQKSKEFIPMNLLGDAIAQIANNADITGDERRVLLQAANAVAEDHAYKTRLEDWENAALDLTDERDRLRILIANREAEIEILNHKINRLERCVIQGALIQASLASRDEEESDERIIFHAGRVVQHEIDHERHTDEDFIGDQNNDLENGNY